LAGHPILGREEGLAALSWTAYEIDRIQEVWRGVSCTTLTQDELSLARLAELPLSRFQTLHLATHAEASTRDPRRCGLVLSHGERMGLAEIAALDLTDALVILSACRSGEGELVPGEGVVGLRWAFLRAGARALVVSLWPVDDASSARLMTRFHERLRGGADAASALAAARRETARTHRNPAHWAPFVVVRRPASGPARSPSG
jgi:CHAT domain-containing protein